MKSVTRCVGLLLISLAMALTAGCDVIGEGAKAAKIAHQDLVKVAAIARVGVDLKEYDPLVEKARVSTNDAISKFGEKDEIRPLLQACIQGYLDGKKILEVKGQVDTADGQMNDIVRRYGVRAPSRFVLPFGILTKLFERTNKAVEQLGTMVK